MNTTIMVEREITWDEVKRYKHNTEEMTPELALLSWDESEMTENELVNRLGDGYNMSMLEREATKEEIKEDFEFWQIMMSDMTDELTEYMRERNPSLNWTARVTNFGWDNRSGIKADFHCEYGSDLLNSVLPRCDCTYYIHNYEENGKKGFAIQNYHHDSPTGNEWYFILPA